MLVMRNVLSISRLLAATLPAGFVVAAFGIGIAAAGIEPADTVTYKPAQAMNYVLGSKRAVGYFMGQAGECRLTLMIAEATDPDVATPPSAARLRLAMLPGQSANFGSAEGGEVTLTCGARAETLEVRRASARS
jgi:hypothetical protein